MSNTFSSSSYYETIVSSETSDAQNSISYLGLFPPSKTCKFTQTLPTSGSRVFTFDKTEPELEHDLFDFLNALGAENFGMKDFLFLLKDYPQTMNAADIINWYRSLYYTNAQLENNVCVATLGSTIDSTYTKKVFLKDITDPQAALDTFIFLEDNGTIYTILGKKRKSPTITVKFSDGRVLDVLEIGLFGSVICGEHLEPNEKAQMNSNWFQYLKNRDETDRDFLKLDAKQVSASVRGTLEELGFVPPKNFVPFLVGKDNMPGRDKRYWEFGHSYKFGYKRPSESSMIAFIGKCTKPELKEPLDCYECSKGTVVDVAYALREFRVGGALDCAFPSHSRMLTDVVKKLPELFQEVL